MYKRQEYGVTPAAVLDVLTGAFDPEGLLPIQIPKDMETVEQQKEDVAFDMECYEDSEGPVSYTHLIVIVAHFDS